MKHDTIISVMSSQESGHDKSSDMANVSTLGTIFSLIIGFFGVIAIFISMMVNVSENPGLVMVVAFFLLLLGAASFYLFRSKQEKDAAKQTPDAADTSRLSDRLENLEALICRLDRELNQQIEQSLFSTGKHALSRTEMSEIPTSLLNVVSALDERYQMLRELGHGGMGVVIQAYDKQLKEQVAIKVLSPLLSFNAEAIERLRREVSAARRVTHPNVIRIHDIAEANGLSYVSMEFFEGMNLKEFIRRHGACSTSRGYQIASQICDGLKAAHDQGVIHRDLKSQNVILNRTNQIKIIDFGLARSKHLEGMTATGLIMGTPEYMAPEQVAGKNVDERADIYSLGIILYELFTGNVPFSGETAIAIGFKQMKDEPVPPRSLDPKIPEQLEHVILKALQKDPRDRYSSCAELLFDLEKVVQLPSPALETADLKEPERIEPTRE